MQYDEPPPFIYLRPRPPAPVRSPAEVERRAKAVARTLAWRARNEANGLPRTGNRPTLPLHARALTHRQAMVLSAFQRAYAEANLLRCANPHLPLPPNALANEVPLASIVYHLPVGLCLRRDVVVTALRQLAKRKWLVDRTRVIPGNIQRSYRYGWFDRSTLSGA